MIVETTINQVFRNRADRYGPRLAVEKKLRGCWQGASWRQYYEHSRAVGLGLRQLGVQQGDRVALLADNRLEWLYTDMGTLGVGGCVVTIYPTLTAAEVAYIVRDSGSRVLVVEDGPQLAKARHALAECPHLQHIVVMEPPEETGASILTFAQLETSGQSAVLAQPELFESLAASVTPGDMATIVYTSGTTGTPKGAVISHGNIMAVIRALDAIEPSYATDRDRTVPFLPLSHVFERAAGHFYGMFVGITASYAESVATLLEDLREKRPTMILAVPRVCEKVYQKIQLQVAGQPAWRRRVFHWGHGIGARMSTLRETKTPAPLWLRLAYALAYGLIFRKLQEALGGRVRWMTASGAPTAREIVLFFNAAGIIVVEGYGMTECFAPATMSNLADYRIGTVGKPLPGVAIRLAEDGEILIKGDNVFQGYWNLEKETRQAFTADGYFRSGDIGSFDADGFLTITDRKKNLIITSGGKNIAPQKIENLFLSDPLFAQFMVIGEGRRYLTALVVLNLEVAAHLARRRSIAFQEPHLLLDDARFLALVDDRVAAKNAQLARFETIKRYQLLKREFSQETGELTPSLKLRRRKVMEIYSDMVEALYADEGPAASGGKPLAGPREGRVLVYPQADSDLSRK
jgi:long-chain acyl-CoA synthetase